MKSNSIIGSLPTKNTVVASADSIYLLEHGKALVNSCKQHNNNIHLHVINPTEAAFNLLNDMDISYTFERTNNVNRVYYACNRFLIAPYLLSSISKLLIVDIDCYFNQHFEFLDNNIELGLFLRDDSKIKEMKVLAGMLYLTENSRDFINLVIDKLHSLKMTRWFVDQIAIHESWIELYSKSDRLNKFFCFNKDYMNWDFDQDSIIWTGKGARKRNNKVYINRKKIYENYSI